MPIRFSARSILPAAAAAALLAALVLLYLKTEAPTLKSDTRALALLRDMKQLDDRWDLDALRLANDLSPRPAPAAEREPLVRRLLQELSTTSESSAIAPEIAKIRDGLEQKSAAFRDLRSEHGRSVTAIAAADEAFSALAAGAIQARTREPRNAERASALAASAEQLRAALGRVEIEEVASAAAALDAPLATLRHAALAVDPILGPAAARAEYTARSFLSARAAEANAWRKLSYLTVGGRIELASRTLETSLENFLDEKERWRVYLFAYAMALLVGLAYLASRVASAQRALRAANEALERRVAERTRELSQALEQLKESEAQLVQSEKMSSLGQLVAGVAHEINTPLAYVKNSLATARGRMAELREALDGSERLLALLQAEPADAAALHDSFDTLATRLERLRTSRVLEDLETLERDGMHGIDQIGELIANLRSFARLDRSKVASFNVNEGVKATMLIAKPLLRKVDVEMRLAEIPSITCSPSQVNQVLLNLVTNAAQAIDKPRGRIVVATRAADADAVAIEVTDNGRGIPAEVLPRIFDPFFTTKAVGKGTGLGLSIAYKIVNQHGGRIDVRSQPGAGSTFTVTLPIQPPAALCADVEREAEYPA